MRIDAASLTSQLIKRTFANALPPVKPAQISNQTASTSATSAADALDALKKLGANVPGSNAPAFSALTAPPPSSTPAASSRISAAVHDLLKHWGTSDPDHDLNADGTVDTIDLGILLSQLGASSPAGQNLQTPASNTNSNPAPGTSTTVIPDATSPMASLLSQWGQTSSQFDLNHDGTVNSLDLGILIASMDQSQPTGSISQAPAAAPGSNLNPGANSATPQDPVSQLAQNVTDLAFAALDNDHDGRIPVADLPQTSAAPIATLASQLDQDGDGIVTPAGMFQAVHDNLTQALTKDTALSLGDFANKWIAALTPQAPPAPPIAASSDKPARLGRLADLIAQRLARKDMTAASATALRKSIDDSNLAAESKSRLLGLIGTRFPRGLNVNAVV